jgi:hypothetical protein
MAVEEVVAPEIDVPVLEGGVVTVLGHTQMPVLTTNSFTV